MYKECQCNTIKTIKGSMSLKRRGIEQNKKKNKNKKG